MQKIICQEADAGDLCVPGAGSATVRGHAGRRAAAPSTLAAVEGVQRQEGPCSLSLDGCSLLHCAPRLSSQCLRSLGGDCTHVYLQRAGMELQEREEGSS